MEPNNQLFEAIKNQLYGGVDIPEAQQDKIDRAVIAILLLVESHFASRLKRLSMRFEKTNEQGRTVIIQIVLLMAFISFFRNKKKSLSQEEERRFYHQLKRILITTPDAFYAIARIASGVHAENDPDLAERVIKLTLELGYEIQPNDFKGATTMNPDELIAKIMEQFAFDEAKLPKRLHYDRDPRTNEQILSDGQKYLIIGTIEALTKIAGAKLGCEEGDIECEKGVLFGTSAVLGLLLLDGHHDPDDRAFFDNVKEAFVELMEPASTERKDIIPGNNQFESNFDQKFKVFIAVAELLTKDNKTGQIFFDAYASVSRSMVSHYDTRPPGNAGFPYSTLALYHDETLSAGNGGGGGSGIAFLDLPPLNGTNGTSDEIIEENVQAVTAIYVVYQCNQMMLFPVVDRIVELFMAGLLPMGGDVLARKLDDWYWKKDDRISPAGLNGHFTRALGVPGGDVGPDVTANTDFEQRLLNTVSCFAEAYRSRQVSSLFENGGRRVMSTNDEYCRKAARDLAANCTLYGYAGAQFAAERMGIQLREAMEILQLPRIREIYGVSTMYQVIERVAQSEFGTTVNVVKHRTMAEEVRTILDIIAEKHHIWSLSSGNPLFTDEVNNGDLSKEESDKLFRAAQHILAVNGIQSDTVQQYSQPVETPALPSIPGMGTFGGADMGGMGAGGSDIASQLKGMLDRGETPSAQQIRGMVGF